MINPSDRHDTFGTVESTSPSLDSLPTEEFLRIVGLRVRSQRATMSMSRKRLAEVSGVSERYLAQLESGQGNMSIALLRKVTTAIGMSLAALLSGDTPELGSTAESFSGNGVTTPATSSSSRTAYARDGIRHSNPQRIPESEL
ncbi:MAG: helix-turn-helix domain-containing protein [Granulosicoccus sp.]